MKTSQSHFFIVQSPGAESIRVAVRVLRELGIRVVGQHGTVAIEAIGTATQVRSALATGLFSTGSRRTIKTEDAPGVPAATRELIDLWNARSIGVRGKDGEGDPGPGTSWGVEGRGAPGPLLKVPPSVFRQIVLRVKAGKLPALKTEVKRLEGPAFAAYENRLLIGVKDSEVAGQLGRSAWAADDDVRRELLVRPLEIGKLLADTKIPRLGGAGGEAGTCETMSGRIAVGIVVVEGSTSGLTYTPLERTARISEIIDGLSWLAGQHPGADLTWVYNIQHVTIDVANGGPNATEDYWRDSAIAKIDFSGNTYAANLDGLKQYQTDLAATYGANGAIVLFITRYATFWFAFAVASSAYIVLCERDNWGGWGLSNLDRVALHEVCHLFGAADEYTGSGTPCSVCDGTHGCCKIPNGNCGMCASRQMPCAMGGNSYALCAYTRAMIGWSTLFVEAWTSSSSLAGTNDNVWLDIGDRQFLLDTPSHDDFERGEKGAYAIYAPDVEKSDIQRLLVRKAGDGALGAWKLRRLRVRSCKEILCDVTPETWLEDDQLSYLAAGFNSNIVNKLEVRITTADIGNAGTDNDVEIELAGRIWDLDNPWHNDFVRAKTDVFKLNPGLGLYKSAISSVWLRKSPDTAWGGWKLKGVQILINGMVFYDNQSINKWLKDDDLSWYGAIT